jgi:hypothetical protein
METDKQKLTKQGWINLKWVNGKWYGLMYISKGSGAHWLGKDLLGERPTYDWFALHDTDKALDELRAIEAQQQKYTVMEGWNE